MPRIEIELTDDEFLEIKDWAEYANMGLNEYIIDMAKTYGINRELLEELNASRLKLEMLKKALLKKDENLKDTENHLFTLKSVLEEKQFQEREHYSLLAERRHAINRQRKTKAIEHFEQEQTATQISKNQFAKQYASQYHVSEKTLREWLKNCEIATLPF